MRSLFLRIFLWFWLVTAVMIAIVVASSPYWTRVRPEISEWERRVFARLVAEGERLAEMVAAGDIESLATAVEGRGHSGLMGVFLVDEFGVEVFGTNLPEHAATVLEKAQKSGDTETARKASRFFLARPVHGPDDQTFTMLLLARGRGGPGGRHRPPHPTEILDSRVVLPRLLMIVLVVGGLCYWLSRYLTSPLIRLRGAARELAEGELSARVGQGVGSRRDEIGDLARDFDAMAERIEDLVSSQQQLLRDVSHELRSPLARLEVALGLAQGSDGAQLESHLDRIGLESNRLNNLIGDLLTLARIEDDTVGLERTKVDLVALLNEVVADAGFEAQSRGSKVLLEAGRQCSIEGSPNLLHSAVDNVLRNAVRFTSPDSEIDVELTIAESEVSITVRDRGPGVPEDQLQRIFKPFARVGEARDRVSGGKGLGLAIAERAMHLHGGSASAKNRPGGGLEVLLRFPR